MDANARAPATLVVAAFVMTLSSAFGQTFFIGLFAPMLKADLGLSDGWFGGFYTLATLASAMTLFWSGKFADRMRIRALAVGTLLGLALAAVAMAHITAAWLLIPVLFVLRLFGQGAQSHLAITGMGRWYRRRRGRMMAIGLMGVPTSEALMPSLVVLLIAAVGWRQTWLIGAAFLCLISIPLVLWFLRREPAHNQALESEAPGRQPVRDWTRGEVMRTPLFYAVVAGIVTPAFGVTAVFFNIGTLAETKGWSLSWYAAWLPLYAVVSVIIALVTGWLVDRLSARRLLPLALLPLALSLLVMVVWSAPEAVPVFLALLALTQGSSQTLLGALWAELFGTRHLGAIRSVAVAAQVLATALAPGLIGLLLDFGIGLDGQYLAMSLYTFAAAIGLYLLQPGLRRLAAPEAV